MTRTDVVASSRPHGLVAPQGARALRSRRSLLAIPIALLLAAALVSPSMALAAESTTKEGLSGYGKEPKKEEPKKEEPKKEEPKKEEPKSGTSPSKETSPPSKETAPESKSTAPSTESTKSGTLPFTGLDLRLVVAIGIVMMGAGFSIVVVQRRQRRR